VAIEISVREALDAAGFHSVSILSRLSPPWTTDWITEEGREKLRAYGIAPPERGDGRGTLKEEGLATCPQCGSKETAEISRFGSTPCKSLWRCLDCQEPFDRFKCI
jgi:ring-1,2-phenylacetyl-CoA epoxidase subunit PaaD